MVEVVIAGAVRTPIGKFGGALASLSAVELGTAAAKAVFERTGIDPEKVDQAIFGNVYQAGSGQNVARQVSVKAGMPVTSTAMTVNEVCGSGLKAIRLGQAAIVMGDADIVLVGGTESMTNVPYYDTSARWGAKFGDRELVDGLVRDGLQDAFSGVAMGNTAENVAAQYNVTREEQDAWALESHRRAIAAQDFGKFEDEIVPLEIRTLKGTTVVKEDEGPRRDTSLEKLGRLRTSFVSTGTVTAGNASSLNDGASAMLLLRRDVADKMGIKYDAVLDAYAEAGVDPQVMGYAPYYVVKRLLKKTGTDKDAIDRYELNEAFAAQSVAVTRALDLDTTKVNVNGGAIALGHPLGDSGARIVTTLIHELKNSGTKTGIAALCIGGGLGVGFQLHVVD